jgi:hypothetical protein
VLVDAAERRRLADRALEDLPERDDDEEPRRRGRETSYGLRRVDVRGLQDVDPEPRRGLGDRRRRLDAASSPAPPRLRDDETDAGAAREDVETPGRDVVAAEEDDVAQLATLPSAASRGSTESAGRGESGGGSRPSIQISP